MCSPSNHTEHSTSCWPLNPWPPQGAPELPFFYKAFSTENLLAINIYVMQHVRITYTCYVYVYIVTNVYMIKPQSSPTLLPAGLLPSAVTADPQLSSSQRAAVLWGQGCYVYRSPGRAAGKPFRTIPWTPGRQHPGRWSYLVLHLQSSCVRGWQWRSRRET